MASEHWKDEPEEQDFTAARTYLSLLLSPAQSKKLAKALERSSGLEHFMAKDILRASRLPLLPADNHEVAKDLGKVRRGPSSRPSSSSGAPLCGWPTATTASVPAITSTRTPRFRAASRAGVARPPRSRPAPARPRSTF